MIEQTPWTVLIEIHHIDQYNYLSGNENILIDS